VSVVAHRSVTVRVPATSANLGPGFDTLGLALGLYDELKVTSSGGTEKSANPALSFAIEGVGAKDVPRDASNLVVRAIARTFEHAGQPLPRLHLEARNVIPHGSGLGSSAAAIVSGIMAARGLLDGIVEIDSEGLLGLATELEGHPDNVAPALFGGLTIAWTTAQGPRAKKLVVHRGVSPVVFVPAMTVSTKHVRSLQPASVPYEDAVFNISRTALLIAALVQSPELLLQATEDRLHQDYRSSAMPQTSSLIAMLRAEGLAAVVSGAGPSLLVLANDPAQRQRAVELVAAASDPPWRALMLAVDFKGATVQLH